MIGLGSVIVSVGWCAYGDSLTILHSTSLYFIIKIKTKEKRMGKERLGVKKKGEGMNCHLGEQMRERCI